MSSTFLRGLALVEIVGLDGPVGISELARRLGADKASVSRMVSAAAEHGWLVRTSAGVELGPRLPVLGHHTALAGVLRDAQSLVDTVAGVTGLFTHVYFVVGRAIMPVLAGGRPPVGLPTPPGLEMPIWTVAAGRAIASLMSGDQIDDLLPPDPLVFPPPLDELSGQVGLDDVERVSAAPPTMRQPGQRLGTRAEFLAVVAEVRRTGIARDRGEVHPLIHCIAAPWDGLGPPAAISVIGHVDDITNGTDLIEAVLRAAVTRGATRERIVLRAADVAHRP